MQCIIGIVMVILGKWWWELQGIVSYSLDTRCKKLVFFNFTAHLCIVAYVLHALVATEQTVPNLTLVIMSGYKIWINYILLKPEMICSHHYCGRWIRGPLFFWLLWLADGLCLMILQVCSLNPIYCFKRLIWYYP